MGLWCPITCFWLSITNTIRIKHHLVISKALPGVQDIFILIGYNCIVREKVGYMDTTLNSNLNVRPFLSYR
jgi:hypothetical protein